MRLYRLTAAAKADLRSIWFYIATDNLDSAGRVRTAVYDACIFLAKSPMSGHMRQDLTRLPIRFWTLARFANYVIVYNPATRLLEIIRILHGARNIGQQLKF